jgi:hypothetical protein
VDGGTWGEILRGGVQGHDVQHRHCRRALPRGPALDLGPVKKKRGSWKRAPFIFRNTQGGPKWRLNPKGFTQKKLDHAFERPVFVPFYSTSGAVRSFSNIVERLLLPQHC